MGSQILSIIDSQASIVPALLLCVLGAFFVIQSSFHSKRALSKIPLWGEELPAKTRRDALLKDSKSIYFESYLKVALTADILHFVDVLANKR